MVTETKQTQRSSEAADQEQREHERSVLKDVREPVRLFNKRFQHEILSTALAEVQPAIDAADKLIAMEGKVRAIYGGLDSRTKALFTVLQALSAVEGQSVGVDYGSDMQSDFLNEPEYPESVEQALKENPKDEDLKFLAEVYELARTIREEDAQPAKPQAQSAPPSETPAAQAEQPLDKAQRMVADAIANPPKPKKYSSERTVEDANPAEKVIVDWLLKQPYATKLACMVFYTLHFGDHGTNGIADEIDERYRDEIFANAKNPSEGLSAEESVMTGVCTEMELWHENN